MQRERIEDERRMDESFGYSMLEDEDDERTGWLLNIGATTIEDKDSGVLVSGVNLYFMCQDGSTFKTQLPYMPYFYVGVRGDAHREVEFFLRRRFENLIADVVVEEKEDLDLKNHLTGLRNPYLKVSFVTVSDLMEVKRELLPLAERNSTKNQGKTNAYTALAHMQARATDGADGGGGGGYGGAYHRGGQAQKLHDYAENIVDLREYDVPYHMRFAIDNDVRCGNWFRVRKASGRIEIEPRPELKRRAETRVCAFDIEATKLPLQFPNPEYDQVFMISYMLDKQGYLIINRDIVSEDISDFEYTPKPEYEGPFIVWNEPNEKAVLERWFRHMQEVKPSLYVTYNGDNFDFPFIEKRCWKNGLSMYRGIGMRCDERAGECRGRFASHLDAFAWVNRDSYLPQGSRGLKAVTKAKLRYNPIEIHPEDMVRLAKENPQEMAAYSVSDAVATYYLYMTYVHPFIFSLCTIIPMSPDEVLRKGSGTLCESLLMVEAYKGNIICPNKHRDSFEKIHDGHLLESETYIGGHVEALESGIFRADLVEKFRLKPEGYEELIANLDRDLSYAITTELKLELDSVTNYDEIRAAILEKLEYLRDNPVIDEKPKIYHLDVAAMYPNIILTNRLQPSSIVTDEDCLACDFNRPGKTCLRSMEWVWRGEPYSATRAEYNALKMQIHSETVVDAEDGAVRSFADLSSNQQQERIKDRLKKYCQKAHRRVMNKSVTETRTAGICQRENDFYVGTVLAFRDRRYEYKGLVKKWKKTLKKAQEDKRQIDISEANDYCILYDSLQLAHKCILNSFYGYVMRRGARWYSMEMAGVVTYTGAKIIQNARELVEKIGKPLELDTDGIWCCLPGSFPEDFKIETTGGDSRQISYPCVMLNVSVAENNTNDQYQTLVDKETLTYKTSKEMSIEFEVDGPYAAMILPASKEEGKSIKKRYAVFNFDGSLEELKGFELKRRGELNLIKVFQGEVFGCFLDGASLEEAYASVAAVANRWLDMLDTHGIDLVDEELLDLICEESVMSKTLAEYGDRKSCAISTAKRLGEFLGDERLKDKGLNCKYIISRSPAGNSTTERAIPVAIFSTEPHVARSYLRKWLKDNSILGESGVPDIRDVLDWDYYKSRLGSAIQKIITIPAAMQKVKNPVPRVEHPDWLHKRVRERDDAFRQKKVTDIFKVYNGPTPMKDDIRNGGAAAIQATPADLEDFGTPLRPVGAKSARVRRFGDERTNEDVENVPAARDPAAAASNGGSVLGTRRQADGAIDAQRPRKAPRRRDDFQGWINFHKMKWLAAREERKRAAKRLDRGGGLGNARQAPTEAALRPGQAVDSFFREQASAAVQQYWQIIQVTTRPAGKEVEHVAWVYVDGAMYSVPLHIPKNVHVTLRSGAALPEALSDARVVRRIVPYSAQRDGSNALEVSVPAEAQRDGGQRYASEISMLSGVDAVYEVGVPSHLSAVLDSGCVCVVAHEARNRPMAQGFAIEELAMKSTIELPYLDDDVGSSLAHLTLYHALVSDTRGIFALTLPATRRGHVVVVNQGGGREISVNSLSRRQRQIAAAEDGENAGMALPRIRWEVEYSSNSTDACRIVQRLITEYRQEHRGPLLALTQGSEPASTLASGFISALNDMPYVELPPSAADLDLPTLGWQAQAANTALGRCASAQKMLEKRIAIARYAQVPVGNLSLVHTNDCALSVSDVFFARALRDNGQLLWWKDGATRGLRLMEGRHPDEQPRVQIQNPGVYRSVCVDLDVYNVLVNSIEKSGVLNELEGGALLGLDFDGGEGRADDGGDCGADETSRALHAFKVLRALVQTWLADASDRDNEHANELLMNLHRWISSPTTSALYDPVLLSFVNDLAQKMFALLIAEMKHLGAEIVSADFGHITLCTGKRDAETAEAYVSYLVKTLKSRELFTWLNINTVRYWHTLVYLDPFNYGGVEVQRSRDDDADGSPQMSKGKARRIGHNVLEDDDDDDDDDGGGKNEEASIVCEWNIEHCLPRALQDHFRAVVSEFIYRPWKHSVDVLRAFSSNKGGVAHKGDDDQPSASTSPTAPVTPGVATQSIVAVRAQMLESKNTAFLSDLVKGYFTSKMLSITRNIVMHIHVGSGNPDHEFPFLAGSHLDAQSIGSPALAFVRSVCAVFALDDTVRDETAMMRKVLLKLLHVKEFSKEAMYVDLCRPFVLRNVSCSACHDCRDIDICRDRHLNELGAEGGWRCHIESCKHPYDLEAIENMLVEYFQRNLVAYNVQDLRCNHCGQIKGGRLQEQHCGGSKTYSLTVTRDAEASKLLILHNIATIHEMDLLREMVEWVRPEFRQRYDNYVERMRLGEEDDDDNDDDDEGNRGFNDDDDDFDDR